MKAINCKRLRIPSSRWVSWHKIFNLPFNWRRNFSSNPWQLQINSFNKSNLQFYSIFFLSISSTQITLFGFFFNCDQVCHSCKGSMSISRVSIPRSIKSRTVDFPNRPSPESHSQLTATPKGCIPGPGPRGLGTIHASRFGKSILGISTVQD